VSSTARHQHSVLEIGDHRRIVHHLVIAGRLGGSQGLRPLHVDGMAGRLEQHQMLISLIS